MNYGIWIDYIFVDVEFVWKVFVDCEIRVDIDGFDYCLVVVILKICF